MVPLRFPLIGVLFVLGCGPRPAPAPNLAAKHAGSCVQHEDRLIFLSEEDGSFKAWSVADGQFDEGLSTGLSRLSITHVASDGETLWGADRTRLLSWSKSDRCWTDRAIFIDDGEALRAIALVGKTPLLVFPSKVVDALAAKTFKVPDLRGQTSTSTLRILAIHPGRSMLWIGSGFGEWGGHLVGLDPRTGRWVQFVDDLHYATGIAQEGPDEILVSWSMSHFTANTLIRVHGPDGQTKRSFPELDSKYYQAIVFSPVDQVLYGVEGRSIVEIKDGRPLPIAEFAGRAFERETNAIGVAPGIASLLPIGPRTLIVTPKHGLPWKLQDRELTQLVIP